MGDFLMPSLGADMEFGTVLEWKVQPGDAVHRGDIVATVDTEKSDIDVEVFEDGVVEALLVPVGAQVPVGTPLARIGSGAVAPAAAPPPVEPVAAPVEALVPAAAPAPAVALAVTPPAAAPTPAPASARSAAFVRASPRARSLAAAQGVELSSAPGSGPDGAVVAADLARRPRPTAPVPDTAVPHKATAMRRAIGSLMARAKREIPHYYLATTIDMAAATAWLRARNEGRPVDQRVLPIALLLKAVARAARDVPGLNGFWVDDAFAPAPAVHLGVAVSLRGGGLVAPALKDADTLAVDDLMAALVDLVRRARTGGLRSSEMSEPTITVTNLGDTGVEEVFGVIYPPQVALVGLGRMVERPWAVDGRVECRPVVRATLSADHRASDGHQGARFLALVGELLQRPEEL